MKYLPLPLLCLLAACGDSPIENPSPPTLDAIGDFTNPTFLAAPPGDTGRLFVTERIGRIRLLKHDVLQARPFLDIVGKMSSADENGLYSMAFHPQYATNGRFYVFFTNLDGDIRVVRYVVSSNPDSADESAADTILAVPHPIAGTTLPFGNHHGGQAQFGPDGMLYVSLGDGGCCGDPLQNGQRTHTLNGKILRIDVDGATGYTVPGGNPFVSDTSFSPETWAWGLRNPWRFSFDRQTGDLYIADVGQDAWEEVDVAAAPNAAWGLNYGWSIMEGTHCYASGTCDQTGITLPVIEYAHSNGACDVQGGYVYRGTRVTQLAGRYLYADYCAGFVRSFTYSGGVATQSRDWPALAAGGGGGGGIVSFGEDARGELYIMTYGGTLYRIVPGT
ncbi:MAG TPA: PQQ-dependent sugar dehydrogenase [Gemmatimonadales bacterium]|nr:PQQ-dependent sugar dehydrogenase [Gemmatimonadales bacterium]